MEGTGGTVNKPSHFPSHAGLQKREVETDERLWTQVGLTY
jgi:hypothetical protein